MDCNEYYIRFFCRLFRLASIIVVATATICHASDNNRIEELASEIYVETEIGSLDSLVNKFDELEETLSDSSDPITEARVFLESFIQKLNYRYGINLSLLEICIYIKNNIDAFNIPIEIQPQFLKTIDLLIGYEEQKAHGLHWPWEWNWFGLNKKDKEDSADKINNQPQPIQLLALTNYSQLDGASIVGILEIVAGASIGIALSETIIGPVIGGALVADGVHRIANKGQADIEEVLRERRTQPYPDQQ